MKKNTLSLLTITFFLVISIAMSAQSTSSGASLKNIGSTDSKKQSENSIKTVNDLKSGNWQDVVSSFFQLAFSDLAGDNKAISFRANLFALKAKADSNLLMSENYVQQKFSRNFQFDFALRVDTSYKFKGFQAGFTWAIVNKRDSSVISYANTQIDRYFINLQSELLKAFNKYRNSLVIKVKRPDGTSIDSLPDNQVAKVVDVRARIQKILDQNYFAPKEQYPEEIQKFLDDKYITNFEAADREFKAKLERLRLKPLLTFSVNSNFQNKDRAFTNGAAQLIYLQGFKTFRTKTEFDIRSSINIKDTAVATITRKRTVLNSSLGINFALLENNKGKSIIEFKPYLEYNNILTTPYATEKRQLFMANADLRFRILENFWIPLTIKYDIENGKFLGFLDVEFNFNAFKKQK
jgi:hypothetical protein